MPDQIFSAEFDDLEQFTAVCPHCSASFELNADVIVRGFDDERAEEYLKITCPVCEETKMIDCRDE
jgi:hypothetical protein